ncbi:MAG: HAD family phosphatase [Muribaculaceae bacterium]|nr:HAD family phosphatase [Muribaculaceae bacterium]
MSRTLFISDLDGTLLGPDGRLTQTTVSLLNHAISRGILFSVATARTPATVSELMRDVNLQIPAVVMTGGALWDKASGRYSEVQFFDPSQIPAVVEAYRASGAGAFLYTLPPTESGRDVFHIYHVGNFAPEEKEFMQDRLGSPFKRFSIPESGDSQLPEEIGDAVLFFGIQPNAEANAAYARLKKIPRINPMLYHDWRGDEIAEIEAFPYTTTKAQGIKRLARMVGADRIVVYGDNLNDLSMMAAADYSVAVSNAVEEVKREVDEVIGSNAFDAVPRHILGFRD